MSGKEKSGAMSPTFNVIGGGAGVVACENAATASMEINKIAISDFVIIDLEE